VARKVASLVQCSWLKMSRFTEEIPYDQALT
jgi:hypothetical protein